MRSLAVIVFCLACVPALAAGYPVSGRWGQDSGSAPGPVDCSGKRVIEFKGDQRTDSGGGVPGYRIKSIEPSGPKRWRVVDYFTSGQIRNGTVSFTLHETDADHIELDLQKGGQLKLRRCK